MIVLRNSVEQTVAPGTTVTFDTVVMHTGCGEGYRPGFNAVKLRCNGIYRVEFSGNISGATAGTPVQLAIALGGVVLPETIMVSTPSAANAVNNVSTGTNVVNCCGDFDRITVTNNGTETVTLTPNFNLRIGRRA